MTKNEILLILITSLWALSNTLSAVFVNVYLYTYTGSLVVMTIYRIIRIAQFPLFFTIGGKWAQQKGYAYPLATGVIISMLAVMYVLFMNDKFALNPNLVYPVNMFYAPSPNKEKAYTEGDSVYGTHTGYLSYDKKDDTWYVTHNIHGKIHKDRFGNLQNSKGNIGVTAIYKPRKNTLFNRVRTRLGFRNGGLASINNLNYNNYYK